MTVLRYILQNPIKANLESIPGTYRWSSYPAYKKGAGAITDTAYATEIFGGRENLVRFLLMKNEDEVMEIRESIKGLVYKFNPSSFDFFNPYMFVVEDLIKDNDDFNRKIQEFNAILKLVTILNQPHSVIHQLYYDEMYNIKDTKIFLASKRDNITALNIFDSANLLPDEIRFANGLIENYEQFALLKDDNMLWEDQVLEFIEDYAVDGDTGYIDISVYSDNLFTLKSLKSTHRTKAWFKKSKNYLKERIKTLLDENIIVNIGKDTKNHHNVYCLNYGLGDSVEDTLPQFRAELVHKATHLFENIYPSNIE